MCAFFSFFFFQKWQRIAKGLHFFKIRKIWSVYYCINLREGVQLAYNHLEPQTFSLLLQFLRDPPSVKHRNNLLCDLACFVVLTPVTVSSAYLCGSGVQRYAQRPDSWQVQGLSALTVCLVFVYFTWLIVSRRLLHASHTSVLSLSISLGYNAVHVHCLWGQGIIYMFTYASFILLGDVDWV